MSQKFYTWFYDEPDIKTAMMNHIQWYKSVEDAIGDSEAHAPDSPFRVIDENQVIVYDSKDPNSNKYKFEDLVQIVNTGSSLDGMKARVIGVASKHYTTTFYILDLGKIMKHDNGEKYSAIQMIDSCIRLVW